MLHLVAHDGHDHDDVAHVGRTTLGDVNGPVLELEPVAERTNHDVDDVVDVRDQRWVRRAEEEVDRIAIFHENLTCERCVVGRIAMRLSQTRCLVRIV